jgi:hypothetical protein
MEAAAIAAAANGLGFLSLNLIVITSDDYRNWWYLYLSYNTQIMMLFCHNATQKQKSRLTHGCPAAMPPAKKLFMHALAIRL